MQHGSSLLAWLERAAVGLLVGGRWSSVHAGESGWRARGGRIHTRLGCREVLFEERGGEVEVTGLRLTWPRAPKRARTGPAAVAWPCHAGRPAQFMRPGGLGQARGRAGSAFYDIAGLLTSDDGLLTVSECSGRGLSCAVCVHVVCCMRAVEHRSGNLRTC